MVSASLAVIWIPTLLPRLSNNMQLTIMIISGILVGGAIALIPAIIKILLGVNEVITALLINYLVLLLSSYELVYTPIASNNSSAPTSIPIGPAIGPIFAIIAVVIIVIGYSLSLQNTVPGFQLRMVGKNSRFAQISGIKSTRTILFAALLGGSLAGLAATGQILGEYHIMYDGFATGLGNNGIIAALIGQNSPIGMVLSSFVLGSLQSGSVLLSVVTNVPSEIVQVITGFVMLFATINFVTILMKPLRRKSD
jgi:simple sugar transport system permease protein